SYRSLPHSGHFWVTSLKRWTSAAWGASGSSSNSSWSTTSPRAGGGRRTMLCSTLGLAMGDGRGGRDGGGAAASALAAVFQRGAAHPAAQGVAAIQDALAAEDAAFEAAFAGQIDQHQPDEHRQQALAGEGEHGEAGGDEQPSEDVLA